MTILQYSIASLIREESQLYGTLTQLRDRMTTYGIKTKTPSMGYHITYIPPFYGSKENMEWFATGLEFRSPFYQPEIPLRGISGTHLDLFHGEEGDEDAVVLRLTLATEIRDITERLRARIPSTTQWVYPLRSHLANFHCTVGKEKNLGAKLTQVREGEELKDLFSHINLACTGSLEPPLLFQKDTNGWHPYRA